LVDVGQTNNLRIGSGEPDAFSDLLIQTPVIEDGNGCPNTSATSSTTDIESIRRDDSMIDVGEREDVPPDLILKCANLSLHRSYNTMGTEN
jgi:hypothetical protein